MQVYRLKTLPFGATHSVYCFLRLARMICAIATQGLYLLCTSFYDDFTLASKPTLCDSSRCGMELVFLLAGWVLHKKVAKQLHSTLFARLWEFNSSFIGLKLAC